MWFFASDKENQWVKWLPLVEWWYNTNYHEATLMEFYEVVYGQLPPSTTSYLPRYSKAHVVDKPL